MGVQLIRSGHDVHSNRESMGKYRDTILQSGEERKRYGSAMDLLDVKDSERLHGESTQLALLIVLQLLQVKAISLIQY